MTCGKCKFWHKINGDGECRIKALSDKTSLWPERDGNEKACGDYEQREYPSEDI